MSPADEEALMRKILETAGAMLLVKAAEAADESPVGMRGRPSGIWDAACWLRETAAGDILAAMREITT
jgi:hypothetical protein